MFDDLYPLLDEAFGLTSHPLSYGQVAARAIVGYIIGVLLLRFADRRFRAEFGGSYDLIVGVTVGAVFAQAIVGDHPTFQTGVWAVVVILAFHWMAAHLACWVPAVNWVLRGKKRRIVHEGRFDRRAMMRSNLVDADVYEALRLKLGRTQLDDVAEAWFEPNGAISFQLRLSQPKIRVVDVQVDQGVQTVRLEIEVKEAERPVDQ